MSDIRHITPGDPEWPATLSDLADPPGELWVRGANLRDCVERSLAIVGSRSSTAYGNQVASDIAHDAARDGVTTVSGMAYGIDQAAHRGCMVAGTPTVAVLGCGVDRAYPAAHGDLRDRIIELGCVVSEYPPGTIPTRRQFLARNRLIAALAQGTVVVEATVRSGALSTARHAQGLGRPLFAVPGPVTSMHSAGPHNLIRVGVAKLVTSYDDVEVVKPKGS